MPTPTNSTQAKGNRGGPRVSVLLGAVKGANGKNRNIYTFMRKAVADKLGLKATQPTTKVKRGNKTIITKVRGVRSNAIKVPIGKKQVKRGTKTVVVYQYASIPVGPMPLVKVDAFVKKLKNKPTFYISPDGRTQSITQK